jgi:hypothetical protein
MLSVGVVTLLLVSGVPSLPAFAGCDPARALAAALRDPVPEVRESAMRSLSFRAGWTSSASTGGDADGSMAALEAWVGSSCGAAAEP